MEYLEIFLATFALSTIFALGGVGSAIALVPFLNFLSVPLNLAKSIGLLVNTASTITASFLNFKKKLIDFKLALVLILPALIFAPVGAHSSQFINEEIIKIILLFFLVLSGFLLLFYKKKLSHNKYKQKWILFIVGGIIAYISGILGIGGGSFLLPILIFLGYDIKKTTRTVSFIIPFSTFPAFISYISFTFIDWKILFIAFSAAILGGVLGNKLMNLKMKASYIKKLIAILLFIIAIKIAMDL